MRKWIALFMGTLLLTSCGQVEELKMHASLWLYNKLQRQAMSGSAEQDFDVAPTKAVVAGSDITIRVQENTLMFEPQDILVQPGQKLKIKVMNHLKSPLNFLVLHQGDDPVVVAHLAMQSSDADRNWMPSEDYYLAATGPIAPQRTEKLTVEIPKAEGVYYFVSTFPSAPAILRGKFIVQGPAKQSSEESSDAAIAQEAQTDDISM